MRRYLHYAHNALDARLQQLIDLLALGEIINRFQPCYVLDEFSHKLVREGLEVGVPTLHNGKDGVDHDLLLLVVPVQREVSQQSILHIQQN